MAYKPPVIPPEYTPGDELNRLIWMLPIIATAKDHLASLINDLIQPTERK